MKKTKLEGLAARTTAPQRKGLISVDLGAALLKLDEGEWFEGFFRATRTAVARKLGSREFVLHEFEVTDRHPDVKTERGKRVAIAGAMFREGTFEAGRWYRVECQGETEFGDGRRMREYNVQTTLDGTEPRE